MSPLYNPIKLPVKFSRTWKMNGKTWHIEAGRYEFNPEELNIQLVDDEEERSGGFFCSNYISLSPNPNQFTGKYTAGYGYRYEPPYVLRNACKILCRIYKEITGNPATPETDLSRY